MAPGVGKTYRMLQEGVAEADSGRDVVVGYLESHGRAETVAQAEGLEILPRRQVTYRGTPLEEMDLPAVLARKPELCLIDELAHTNAPGVEHEKRYEDVRDVIEAGIDVFSTVNVQHLESLNDQVTQLTGSRTRETIPDEVLSAADEVVLIDLTPEALIARLRAGKVYRPERVQAALNNFFKIENLAALRETALRQVAEDVEVKRLVRDPTPRRCAATRRGCSLRPRRDRRRSPSGCWRWSRSRRTPSAWCAARGARPSAWTPSSTCSSCARPAVPPSPEDRKRLEELRRLTAMLGARLHVEEGEDVAVVAIARGARARQHLRAARRAFPAAGLAPARLDIRSGAADAPAARAAGRRHPHHRRPLSARRAGRGRGVGRRGGAAGVATQLAAHPRGHERQQAGDRGDRRELLQRVSGCPSAASG